MQFPFLALKPEYEQLLARIQITRNAEVVAVARKLIGFVKQNRYQEVSVSTGIPQAFIAASFEREASSNFLLNPAQGDRFDRVSVHVPAGRGPFPDWQTAARDAYHIDHLDAVGKGNWTWPLGCFEGEEFNGFGPRAHGCHTGYLWAGSNIYTGGKYVADDVWNPSVQDKQLGIIPMMKAMVTMDETLDLVGGVPETVDVNPAPPMPAPEGLDKATELQVALNSLGANPQLTVDGNIGRFTRTAVRVFQRAAGLDVDGYAGPKTWAAIDAKLKAKGSA